MRIRVHKYATAMLVSVTLVLSQASVSINAAATNILPSSTPSRKNTPYRMIQNLTRLTQKQRASTTAWKEEMISLAEKYPDTIILNGTSEEKCVVLTFDDGPDTKITPQIMDVLIDNNVTATFFFTGVNIKNNIDIVKKAYKNGFQVAGHSYSHPHFTKLSDSEVKDEIAKTNELIKKAIDVTPAYFRPPYGDLDAYTTELLADQKIIIWSVDTMDWAGSKASEIADYVIDNIQPGDIVLMHSAPGRQETLKAVPLIIKGLKEHGYSFCTVSDLVGTDPYN